MIGDIRKHGKVVPLGFEVMQCFLNAGFTNKEIIIKEQHNCRSTEFWENQNNKFLLLAHEYILCFKNKRKKYGAVYIVILFIYKYNIRHSI